MKLYKIYTENKNLEQIKRLVLSGFSGFTIMHTIGYWKNKEEKSLIIEILTDKDKSLIQSIADSIKFINQQKSVLITRQDVESKLVT